MLSADTVTVDRGRARILDAVSLDLPTGCFTVVVGPNGASKSTLLGVLSGALTPTAGMVRLDGRALTAWSPRQLARRRAVLAQHAELSFPLSVREVVLLGRSPFVGLSSRDDDQAIAERALAETETAHLAGRIYTTLSGGERQRVQLARVLAQIGGAAGDDSGGPPILMLDEPTSSLDLPHQHACLRLARAAADRGAMVLAVLHDLNLAAMFADRVCVLRRGRLAGLGTPDEVITDDLVSDVFELPVRVTRHPTRDCPHVMAI